MVLPTVLREGRLRAGRLAARTTFGIGGTPEFLFEPASEAEAAHVLAACRRSGVPLRVLGGGSNLLVDDGELPGAVLATRRLRAAELAADGVRVGAGGSFARLVGLAPRWRIPVLAGCPGIPGTIGGAIAMNAGGSLGTVGDSVVEVAGLDLGGRPFRRRVRPAEFGYRTSPFQDRLVTRAVFRRDPGLVPRREQRRLREALARKRRTQPLGARSAGCVFRNPTRDGRRLSAGRLIEEAGLKGRRVGGAVVSRVHANFLLNEDRATATDVRTLIGLVQEEVRARHGVALELEVRVWA